MLSWRCASPAEHLLQGHPATPLGSNTWEQGDLIKPTSPRLHWPSAAWGQVPGWPRARGGAVAPEPGAVGSISSLATDFLCGLGQIIRCKARSRSADILREPWFGR